MEEAGRLYLREIYKRFSYLAAWLPNTKLKLGDVGMQQGEKFKQMTSLKELGVPFKVRKGTSSIDFTYTSKSGVSAQTKLAGEAGAGANLPLAKAGISIQFSKEGAFLFQAVGCIVNEIEDKYELGRAAIKLFKAGTWQEGWAVVDTLVCADCATIIVSNSKSATIDLTAKTPVAEANLASLDTGLSVNSQTGDVIQLIASKGLAPLFRLSRVKQSILSKLMGGSQPLTFGGPGSDDAVDILQEEHLLEAVAPE